jgi:hypothetical protein
MFLSPAEWEQAKQRQQQRAAAAAAARQQRAQQQQSGQPWDLRKALEAAGLAADRAPAEWTRRFSFDSQPQPQAPKAPVVRAY